MRENPYNSPEAECLRATTGVGLVGGAAYGAAVAVVWTVLFIAVGLASLPESLWADAAYIFKLCAAMFVGFGAGAGAMIVLIVRRAQRDSGARDSWGCV